MSQRHISIQEREMIAQMHLGGSNQEAIATAIGKHQGTVSRELSRNSGTGGYRPVTADDKARQRRRAALRDRQVKMEQEEVVTAVKAGLRQYWSPEQIVGRLEQQDRRIISHQTIYAWIWRHKAQGGSWHKYLRQGHHKYRRHKRKSLDKRGKIPDRTFIDQRPGEVGQRARFGDWEGDTLIGGHHRGSVISHVERKSQYTVLAPLPVLDHRLLVGASRRAFARHEGSLTLPRKTMTLDNGIEFWSHKGLGAALGLDVYFALPHHPWERGVNEQVNGLIRQFLPKGMNLTGVETRRLVRIERLLNNRPRKTLGYQTPVEVLRQAPSYALRI